MARYSKLGIQVLGLLSTGLLLGYARDKKQRKELLDECDKIWSSIDRNTLFDTLNMLKAKKLVEIVKRTDKERVQITNSGKYRARQYLINALAVEKPARWDGKWRVVIFDIPEGKKKLRDGFRRHLKRLGFHEFQKSVFAIPYPCENEIVSLANLMDVRDNVRYLESRISYDRDLRKEFSI